MHWFYDLKAIHKISILMVLVVISMLVIGVTGFYFNDKADKSVGIMYNDNLKPVRWINLFRIELNANRTNELSIILDTKDANNYVEDIKDRIKISDKDLGDFKKAMQDLHNDKALTLLAGIEQNLTKYREAQNETIKLAMSGQKDKAFENFRASTPLFKAIVRDVTEVANNIVDRADKRYVENVQESNAAKTFIIVVMILSIIICSWLGFLTAFRIKFVPEI